MKKLVIAGYGGFAKEVKWLVERINTVKPEWEFLGYIDCATSAKEVIGNDDFVCNHNEELYAAIAVGSSQLRKRIYEKYKQNENIHFPNLLDPSVIISEKIKLGIGNIICAGSILTVDISIGNFNMINLNCTIGHDVVIKDFVTINPNVNISGNTLIETNASIGTGVQIIQGLRIGENSIVAAGTVIKKNLKDNCIASGNRAKTMQIPEGAAGFLF